MKFKILFFLIFIILLYSCTEQEEYNDDSVRYLINDKVKKKILIKDIYGTRAIFDDNSIDTSTMHFDTTYPDYIYYKTDNSEYQQIWKLNVLDKSKTLIYQNNDNLGKYVIVSNIIYYSHGLNPGQGRNTISSSKIGSNVEEQLFKLSNKKEYIRYLILNQNHLYIVIKGFGKSELLIIDIDTKANKVFDQPVANVFGNNKYHTLIIESILLNKSDFVASIKYTGEINKFNSPNNTFISLEEKYKSNLGRLMLKPELF